EWSYDFEFWQILAVHEADGLALGIDGDEVVDLVGLEQSEGIDAERVGGDGLGVASHEVRDGAREEIGAGQRAAAEVAVGEDAGEFAGARVDEGDAAALGLGHA